MPNDRDEKKQILARLVAQRTSALASATREVDAIRSTKGQIKGFLTKDTLYRLQQVLAYQQKSDDEFAGGRLAVILGLCDTYIRRHGSDATSGAQEKTAAVEKIRDDASVEFAAWGRRQAEAQYLQDAYAGADDGTTRPTALIKESDLAKSHAIPQARDLARGVHKNTLGFNQATLNLINQFKLTEGEILAVKVYTAEDYKYMNPATANSESWMAGRFFQGKEGYLEGPVGEKLMREFMEEGSLHSAMAVSALKKLERKVGLCWRGARLTEAQYRAKFVEPENPWSPPPTKTLNLTSVSTDRDTAQQFADGRDCNEKDKTVSVLTEVTVNNGRDIGDLSIFGRGEGEWLLLPGTVLVTESVELLPPGKPGSPPATRWVFVKEHATD